MRNLGLGCLGIKANSTKFGMPKIFKLQSFLGELQNGGFVDLNEILAFKAFVAEPSNLKILDLRRTETGAKHQGEGRA